MRLIAESGCWYHHIRTELSGDSGSFCLTGESSIAGQFCVSNPLMTALGTPLRSNKVKSYSSSMHHMLTRVRMAHMVCRDMVETSRGTPDGMFMPFYDARLDSMSVNGVPPRWRPAGRVGHRVRGWAGPNRT